MEYIKIFLQVFIALGIVNVWLIRPKLSSAYRGANAKNLKEEFLAYGYPSWFIYAIGGCKLMCASFLILGFWIDRIDFVGSFGLMCLMIGALYSHIKVGDTFKKYMPATVMFTACALLTILTV